MVHLRQEVASRYITRGKKPLKLPSKVPISGYNTYAAALTVINSTLGYGDASEVERAGGLSGPPRQSVLEEIKLKTGAQEEGNGQSRIPG
jgi:hypothetical protein